MTCFIAREIAELIIGGAIGLGVGFVVLALLIVVARGVLAS